MTEYIDREAIRNKLYQVSAVTMKGLQLINQFPAADVAPVVHGEWIKETVNAQCWDGYNVEYTMYKCSECHAAFEDVGYGYDYCPSCGARMDAE